MVKYVIQGKNNINARINDDVKTENSAVKNNNKTKDNFIAAAILAASASNSANNKKPYVCQYCNHGFTREKTLSVHVCENKRRALAKGNKNVIFAFNAYNRFYQKTQNAKGQKTYDDFCHSPYYNAFVKFGSFICNVNPLYPDVFIEYILNSNIKIDNWCSEEVYAKYVVNLIKTESVETALERSIKHMVAWSEIENMPWNQYFNDVSTSRAMFDIKDGKISPWLVLNCRTGKNMLSNFTDQQLNEIERIIEPVFWSRLFKQLPKDVELVRDIAKESNI